MFSFSWVVLIIVTALANRWAGWEKGDRYSAGVASSIAGYVVLGWGGFGVGLALTLWRLVGWQRGHDMGRVHDTLLRDIGVFSAVALVPAVVLSLSLWSWLPMTLCVTLTLCYLFALRVVPYTTKYDHLAIAEILAGITLGATAVIAA